MINSLVIWGQLWLSYDTEVEKAWKIAQTQIVNQKIAQKERILRHIAIRAKTAY